MSKTKIFSERSCGKGNGQEPIQPGTVARSDARPPGMRTVAGSILTSGKTLFRGDFVIKIFL